MAGEFLTSMCEMPVSRELECKLELREWPGRKIYKLGNQRHVDWRVDEIMAGISDFKVSIV